MKINAGDIVNVLSNKHSKDVFIPECKTGATWGSGYTSRIDVWVMEKSWANPLTIGYEIKVSRSDFLNDKKWHHYLPFCNEFYFICPPKLISKDEVPENVGLRWVSANCKKIYTKKKAAYRDVDIPESIFRYILMSRTKIIGERIPFDHTEYWKNWLEQEDEKKEIGYMVSKKIRDITSTRIIRVENENKQLKLDIKFYEEVIEFLKEIGYGELSRYRNIYTMKDRLNRILNEMPSDFIDKLNGAKTEINRLIDAIEKEKNNEEEDLI